MKGSGFAAARLTIVTMGLSVAAPACRSSPEARAAQAPAVGPATAPEAGPAPAFAAGQLPAVAERFAWLVGEWVAEGDGRRESETWVTRGDALHGTSESRVGDEVVHTEAIVIEQRGDAIVYEARPSSQPAHAFTLVDDGPGRARFEDPAHDWPQSIAYVRDGDTLTATVSGTNDGEVRTATWTWTLAR